MLAFRIPKPITIIGDHTNRAISFASCNFWTSINFNTIIETQPLCDGKHKGSGMKPTVFKAETSETKYFCVCKATGDNPFCDGSHNS